MQKMLNSNAVVVLKTLNTNCVVVCKFIFKKVIGTQIPSMTFIENFFS